MDEDQNLSKSQRYAAMKRRLAERTDTGISTESRGSVSSITSVATSVGGRNPTFPFRQVAVAGAVQIVSKRPMRAEQQQVTDHSLVMLAKDGTSGLVVLVPSEDSRNSLLDAESAFIGALALVKGVPDRPVGLLAGGVIYRVVVALSTQYSLLYLFCNGSAEFVAALAASGLSLACDSFTGFKTFLHVSRVAILLPEFSNIAAEEPAPTELIHTICSFPGTISLLADREALAGPDCWSLWPSESAACADAWAAWRAAAVNSELPAIRESPELQKGLDKTLDRVMMEARDAQLPGAALTQPLLNALGGPGPWKHYAVVTLPFRNFPKRVIKITERRIKNKNEWDDLSLVIDAINRALKAPKRLAVV
jgi:hypothetical protein